MTTYPLNVVSGRTPQYGTGKFGQAWTNAVTSQTPDLTAPTNSGNFGITGGAWTFEGWVKTTNTATQVIYGLAGSGYCGSAAGKVMMQLADGGSRIDGTIAINDGTWHHVAFVSTGTVAKMYVDGVLDGTLTGTTSIWTANGAGQWGFGGFGGASGYAWVGSLDEFRVSHVARYTTGFTPRTSAFVSDANTNALYHLDGNSDDTSDVIPAVGGNVKVYTGTAFVAKPVKVWTGTAWVTKPVKRWSGTAWVTTPY